MKHHNYEDNVLKINLTQIHLAKMLISITLTGINRTEKVLVHIQYPQSPITDLRIHKRNNISVALFTYHLDHHVCVVIGLP